MPRLPLHRFATALSLLFVVASSVLAEEREPAPAEVARWEQLLPATPQGVGRPITDRSAWEAVAKLPAMATVIADAEKVVGQPLPEAGDELYLEFSRNGNRSRYQAALKQRHGRLPLLVLAECLENRGRFLAAIEEMIRAFCAEKSWLLPAHDRDLRNFQGKVCTIDLVSAAFSWELATCDYWLGDKLSPETRTLLRGELERRTFAPFESCVKSGKPAMSWLTTTSNWNAVCLADVTGTALAVIDSPQRRAWFAAAAEKYIQCFLSGFTADGYCSEGMGYFNYGFGHFLLLSETLLQASGGKVDLLKTPRVETIARFALRMEVLSGIYPPFADCHVGTKPDSEMMAFLSRRFGWGLRELEANHLLNGETTAPLFRMGLLRFPNSASAAAAAEAAQAAPPLRDWFSEAGILIERPAPGNTHALAVALKGGHNAEHHNHNDVGSFVVALGGSTPLVDPGSEVYTRRTFSGDRYQSGVLNSFGHPVPRVAGQLQRTGREAAAKVLKTEFTETTDTIVLDLRSAYAVDTLETLERTFVFSREQGGSLTVTDHVRFSSPASFGTALITFSPWKESGQGLVVGEGADAVQAEIATSGPKWKLQPEEIHEDLPDNRLPLRLGLELEEPVREATITVVIRPASP